MLERPLKLLTVGVAIQSEALQWTRARLIVTSASAAGIALASRALWSTNNAGVNKLRQLTWWSAAISSTSSWLQYEIGNSAGYAGVAYFTVGHFFLVALAFSNTEAEVVFTRAVPMQRLRRITRLMILLVTVVCASTAGILPQLLAINTGGYLEEDLQMSDFHAVSTHSCAIYVRTANCSGCPPMVELPHSFQEGVIGGRLKVWGSGRLLEQNSRTTVVVGTDFEACELWLLVPANASISVDCTGECTLDANGVFAGSLDSSVAMDCQAHYALRMAVKLVDIQIESVKGVHKRNVRVMTIHTSLQRPSGKKGENKRGLLGFCSSAVQPALSHRKCWVR
eukprot:Skav235313  [mRNA]  locus=scaffold520:403781:404794:+ [translate_table: standard]